MISPMMLAWLLPSNAFLPVTISYTSAPKAKRSVRASASLPSSCSGAMYCIVPRIVPGTVSGLSCVVSADSVDTGDTLSFARPKSSSFVPLSVSMMLPGFRSRWTMRAWCALSSASATSMAYSSACSNGSAPFASRCASVSPSRYSITMKSTAWPEPVEGSWWPTSKTGQMCGWLRAASVLASTSNRCFSAGSAAMCSGSTLMATVRFRRVSRPL